MQVNLSVTSSGAADLAADAAHLLALRDSIANTLAAVAADAAETNVLDEVVALRGSLTMSNNRQASTLDAFPIVRQGAPHAEAELQATPRGVWHLVEYGSKGAYEIRPKRGPGGRRTKGTKRALTTPYGLFGRVTHPRQVGTLVWTDAMAAAEPAIDQAVQEAFSAALVPEGDGTKV